MVFGQKRAFEPCAPWPPLAFGQKLPGLICTTFGFLTVMIASILPYPMWSLKRVQEKLGRKQAKVVIVVSAEVAFILM